MKINYLILIAATILLMHCKKVDKPNNETKTTPIVSTGTVPKVQTALIKNVTTITAQSGGTVVDNGGNTVTERGLVLSLTPAPTTTNTKIGTVSVTGAGEFVSEISALKAGTTYYVRAFAVNKNGIGYGNEISFTTTNIGNASFNVVPMFIVGATLATCDIDIINDGGDQVTERGLVYGLIENPTVVDTKIKHNSTGTGKYRLMIKGLLERTNYHVRAYAVNAKGVSYSSNVTFKTIPKGKITYTFNKATNPNAEQLEAYARLQIAVDSAAWYLSNYTSATKHVYLNYVEGTPTADANNEGWMRFGVNSGFQNLRTMLHEMNHTLGTGTTSWWTGKIVGGKFQGQYTNELLKKIKNSTTEQLSGDTQHWWPFGLNQNSEVTSSWDYVYNCILIEAMRKDGLPTATSGPYNP
ncbi:fibronectin type III domain-containing protein [Pedobacter polaris]|uniref:Fibronectin type III domain-containing protein n=1 Tax=Pedobacter polaris TaxID=2571273 RepID=A0A4U1CS13_9SPHI|nr:fibronectin type III domain-containing protein [Pedobacter polaris]TKC10483.1 fibronectin type III domain-containing protein [Pedobacter polaris]